MSRLPTLYLPHGGGPCFFMDWTPPDTWDRMAAWLRGIDAQLGERPRAVLLISGHWEEPTVSINTQAQPPLLFDYYGFPPHTYQLKYPAPGDPALAARVSELLQAGDVPVRAETERGLDHGVFVPFLLIYPQADVPIVQLSLNANLDATAHLVLGALLEPLRDEGILIVGSGMSYHNMRGMTGGGDPARDSLAFDTWLGEACAADPASRPRLLADWERAPSARASHPREEHLLPLMVVAGAAASDPGRRVFQDRVLGATVSAFAFGS
ncbi:MAG: DODA-type extradiol aromatic ring-opening family dioxygenase [Immundisolibacter sp.]|uniref:DODA-type extradiol aromatic ring-opening family dioxygenase n=1 Tax=Immundisolibacter sp. TaxID=1934948 RepID=UPI003EE2BE25